MSGLKGRRKKEMTLGSKWRKEQPQMGKKSWTVRKLTIWAKKEGEGGSDRYSTSEIQKKSRPEASSE